MYCTALEKGQSAVTNKDIGYRKDSIWRKGEKIIIAKGSKVVICWVSVFGDLCGVRLDDGIEVSNIPSYYLESI